MALAPACIRTATAVAHLREGCVHRDKNRQCQRRMEAKKRTTTHPFVWSVATALARSFVSFVFLTLGGVARVSYSGRHPRVPADVIIIIIVLPTCGARRAESTRWNPGRELEHESAESLDLPSLRGLWEGGGQPVSSGTQPANQQSKSVMAFCARL